MRLGAGWRVAGATRMRAKNFPENFFVRRVLSGAFFARRHARNSRMGKNRALFFHNRECARGDRFDVREPPESLVTARELTFVWADEFHAAGF